MKIFMFSKQLPRENAISITVKASALAGRVTDKLEYVSTLIQLHWNVKTPKEPLLDFQKARAWIPTQLQWHSVILSTTGASCNAMAQKDCWISLTSFGQQNELLTQMNISSCYGDSTLRAFANSFSVCCV